MTYSLFCSGVHEVKYTHENKFVHLHDAQEREEAASPLSVSIRGGSL